jgi:hypothetical protein
MKLPVLVAAGGGDWRGEASERDAWSGLPVETGLMRGCTFAGFVSFRPESFTFRFCDCEPADYTRT